MKPVVVTTLKLAIAILLVLCSYPGANGFGPACSRAQSRSAKHVAPSIPEPVSFRDVRGRGLLVRAWVNDLGPLTFALDTGAGATLISSRVAADARVSLKGNRSVSIAGLSGVLTSARPASIQRLAIGDSQNYFPIHGEILISDGLPRDLDGVLDPTEVLWPLGYTINLPEQTLKAFDPLSNPVRISQEPDNGAVVPWIRDLHGRRPFVELDSGERALIDTGSQLGLGLKEPVRLSSSNQVIHDVGGGHVYTRQANPRTIAIGSLTLRRIPTDLISGAEIDAPVLLGLAALRPFRLRFDPYHHLIEITPKERDR